jgi:hypothetical protein
MRTRMAGAVGALRVILTATRLNLVPVNLPNATLCKSPKRLTCNPCSLSPWGRLCRFEFLKSTLLLRGREIRHQF